MENIRKIEAAVKEACKIRTSEKTDKAFQGVRWYYSPVGMSPGAYGKGDPDRFPLGWGNQNSYIRVNIPEVDSWKIRAFKAAPKK